MNIIVCAKAVPDPKEICKIRIDPATKTLMRCDVPLVINPLDKNALEAALFFKETSGASVTVVSMGPPPAESIVKECMALGADRGILLSDRAFGGADAYATAFTLARGIEKTGGFDLNSMAGRHLNPGHALEAMWFIMNTAAQAGRRDLVDRAAAVALAELEFGWDREHGGLFYFMDALGKPHLELQWDMKLWWVHNEALLAAALAHRLTGRAEFATWFQRLHDWTWTHFPDPAYGEWFGYLNRRGEPTHYLKGGKWKGFFHLPRMLLLMPEFLG